MSESVVSNGVLEIIGLFRDYIVRIINGWISVEEGVEIAKLDDHLSRQLVKYVYGLGRVEKIIRKDSSYYVYLVDGNGKKITVYIERLK